MRHPHFKTKVNRIVNKHANLYLSDNPDMKKFAHVLFKEQMHPLQRNRQLKRYFKYVYKNEFTLKF